MNRISILKVMLFILYVIALPFTFPLAKLIPKTSLILFFCSSRHKYSDNTRYIFEYMVSNSSLDVCWVTSNKEIEQYIEDLGGKFVSTRYPIGLIWAVLRARVFVDCGDGKFDPFWISSMSGTILVTTLHGCGPKVSMSRDTVGKSAIQQMQSHLRFNYVNFPSDYAGEWIGARVYNLPNDKIVNLGYPRCDQLITSQSCAVGHRPRTISKQFCPKITSSSTVILYTPTWRPYEYDLPILSMPGFNLDAFNVMLTELDVYLFLTVHSVQVPRSIPKQQTRFRFISTNDIPLFDVSAFMTEVDILLNDYSTTSVDFAHTNRPQISYMPDYKKYKKIKGFAEEYRETLVGPEVTDFDSFKRVVTKAVMKPEEITAEYFEVTKILLEKYNSPGILTSSLRWSNFLEKICSKSDNYPRD